MKGLVPLPRYLLTGATGFLGANVLLEMLRRGWVVACDVSHPTDALLRAADEGPGRVDWSPLDVRRPEDWERLPPGEYRGMVHAAAVTPGEDAGDPVHTAEINFIGTLRALEWAAARRVCRFVFVSSSAVYRDSPGIGPFREEDILTPRSTYAMLKLAAETYVTAFRNHRGLDGCSVRLPSLFGPWERPTGSRQNMSSIFHLTEAARDDRPYRVAGKDVARDWTYVRDAARGLVHMLSIEGGPGIVNLATGRMTSVGEVVGILDGLLPNHGLQLTDADGEMSADLVIPGPGDGRPMAVVRLAESGFRADTPMVDALREYLGWLRRAGN